MKAYQELKETRFEWLGKIPSHWEIIPIKLLEGNSETVVQTGPFGAQLHASDYMDDGVPLILIKHVNNLKIADEDLPKISPEKAGQLSMYRLDVGDIVFSRVGSIGRIALVNEQQEGWLISGQMLRMRIRNPKVHHPFAIYAITGYSPQIYFDLTSVGSTRDSINTDILRNFPVPIPPLLEQQAIADFLDRKTAQIDTLIAKKQRQIELLHEQRTALINHAVTKGLNPNVRMKNSGVEWLGEIPSHWEVVKLKYIGKAFIGLTYNPENVTDEENGTLVFRASNVQDGKIVFDDNVYVKMEIPERLITKVGDILICVRSGSRDLIGKNALIDEKSAGHAFGAFMTVFRSDINYFLSYVFKSQLFKVQSGIFNTSTVNQLTQGNLYDFQVAIPPIDEQEEIIQFLNNELAQIDETVNRVSKQIEFLQEYRTALISEAVTGKVDVR